MAKEMECEMEDQQEESMEKMRPKEDAIRFEDRSNVNVRKSLKS